MMFDEHSEKAQRIMRDFEIFVYEIKRDHGVKFKEPAHDLARRFLNEIKEFEPLEEGEKAR